MKKILIIIMKNDLNQLLQNNYATNPKLLKFYWLLNIKLITNNFNLYLIIYFYTNIILLKIHVFRFVQNFYNRKYFKFNCWINLNLLKICFMQNFLIIIKLMNHLNYFLVNLNISIFIFFLKICFVKKFDFLTKL